MKINTDTVRSLRAEFAQSENYAWVWLTVGEDCITIHFEDERAARAYADAINSVVLVPTSAQIVREAA